MIKIEKLVEEPSLTQNDDDDRDPGQHAGNVFHPFKHGTHHEFFSRSGKTMHEDVVDEARECHED